MCRWWEFAVSCMSWETAHVLCWSKGWLYFISRQTRNWRTYFQGEKWQETQMKNLLSWSRGDKVHCDYIDFKLLRRAGTSLCLVLLMMRKRKEKGMNTLPSASKYFVASIKIWEKPCPPDIPNRQNKGVPASSVELKGNKRHSEIETCFFSLSSLPLCPGFWREEHTVPCSVCNRCLQSVCAPSSARDDVDRKQSMSWVGCTFGEKYCNCLHHKLKLSWN